jgi:hypothetical protein
VAHWRCGQEAGERANHPIHATQLRTDSTLTFVALAILLIASWSAAVRDGDRLGGDPLRVDVAVLPARAPLVRGHVSPAALAMVMLITLIVLALRDRRRDHRGKRGPSARGRRVIERSADPVVDRGTPIFGEYVATTWAGSRDTRVCSRRRSLRRAGAGARRRDPVLGGILQLALSV